MSRAAIYLLYGVTLVLALGPLVHILQRRKFQTYYAYFVALAGFVVFNLAGALSPNIVGKMDSPQYYLLLLVIAGVLVALYPLLMLLARSIASRGGLEPLRPPQPAEDLHHRRVFLVLAAGSLALTLPYFIIARPLVLRFDLLGDWLGLMAERSRIMDEAPMFGWFSMFLWDLPALLLVMLVYLQSVCARAGQVEAARRWGRTLWMVLPVAVMFSVAYFHVLPLAYLLAGMGLAAFVVRGRLPMGMILRWGLPASLLTAAIYMTKIGAGLGREGLERTWGLLVHRLFEVYAWAGAVAVYVFPREHPYLEGRSFVNFMGLFNYQQVDLSGFIYPYIYSGWADGGAPVPAVMEGWANFGWAGALGILAVVVLLILGISWLSWSTQPFLQALAIYLAVKMVLTWQAAIWFGILTPPMLLFVPAVWAVYRLLQPPPARVRPRLHPAAEPTTI